MPTESPTAEIVVPKENRAWPELPFHHEWLDRTNAETPGYLILNK